MPAIQSQTFAFGGLQRGAQVNTVPGTVSGVPLDGSAPVVVPFFSAFLQACLSVQLQYNPATETDYQVSTAIIGTPTLTGFTMVATGGPVGSTGTFTYEATGI